MAPPPGILEVRCAGCGETLEVEHGLTEFACPDCGMAQALPPELMPPRPRRALPLPGRASVVPSAVPAPATATAAAPPTRVSCGGCAAVLSVPHGPGRFSCPLCGAEIAPPPPLAAVVSVVAPPAAIPITSNRPAMTSEVLNGNSNQPTLAGQVQKSIIPEQHYKHSFREESFSSFRVDSRTQIPDVGRLQNECVNPSADREESRTEPPNGTMTKPGKKKTTSAAGPKSHPAGKLQEEHISKAIHASRAQGMPSNSVGGGFHNGMIAVHNKQKTGHIAAPSAIEHEQINTLHQVCDKQQPGENSSDLVHVEQVQVACKAVQNNKKGTKYTKGNQKRQGKSPLNYSTELPHLRRSQRLTKGSPDPIDIEPIHRIDASPNQNQSETPPIERAIDDTYHISPNQHRYPQSVSNKLDNADATTPALNHSMQQKERIPQCYSQMYSPESRWVLPNRSSNSCHEHEMPNESFDGIVQLDSSDDEVHSIPLENQNQDMDGQLEQQACAGKNLSEHGRQKNGFIGSSGDAKHHGGLSSGMGTRHQMNLAASCSRLAVLLPVADATPLPTISSPSSFEKLPVNCSSPTTPHQHHQPSPIYSQDARNGDMLSASVSKSSKKRRGRAPAVLMEPRKEADRPVLTPCGAENWTVHPSCLKVTTTLSLLIKQNYPGTYVSVGTNGQPCELAVFHWHQCPSDIRDTVLDEFLKRYKWSPGQEEECRKIFDRKAVRQLVNLFCYEKQRVRDLLAKKAKRSSTVVRASRSLEEGDGREDSEEQHGDESVLVLELDDPLNWKPFVPEWMQPKWWEKLCDHWAKDEVMKVSYQKRKNRNAGNPPCNASGSQSIAMHQQFTDTTYEHTAEAREPVQEHMGGCKRGRYYCDTGVRKKVQTDSLPKSSPGCSSNHGQGQPPMFTHEQVQQMINQALQGLNETWEKKFLSLEQNMRSMSKSRIILDGPKKGSLAAVAGDKRCQLSCQDTLDSVDGEKDPAGEGEDDPENQDYDDDEHWS
uniref:Uncharacterized protein n=1 Tax=Oryza glaberrima TaxID=4538 RepID=I1PPS4_ORYGL